MQHILDWFLDAIIWCLIGWWMPALPDEPPPAWNDSEWHHYE